MGWGPLHIRISGLIGGLIFIITRPTREPNLGSSTNKSGQVGTLLKQIKSTKQRIKKTQELMNRHDKRLCKLVEELQAECQHTDTSDVLSDVDVFHFDFKTRAPFKLTRSRCRTCGKVLEFADVDGEKVPVSPLKVAK